MNNLILLVQCLCLLALAIAAILFLLGIRGRQIHNRPTCRRCRFDLSGSLNATPPQQSATRCPECGSSLAKPSAIRPGLRRPRPALIAAATLLLFINIIGIGVVINKHSPTLIKYLPSWYLVAQTMGPQDTTVKHAVTELNARAAKRQLSAAHADRLIWRALAFQADPNEPWLNEWGQLICTLRAKGLVTDPQFTVFLKQGVQFAIETRPTARSGEFFFVTARPIPTRLGNVFGTSLGSMKFNVVKIDAASARAAESPPLPDEGGLIFDLGSLSTFTSGGISVPLTAPVGETQLTIVLDMKASASVYSYSLDESFGEWIGKTSGRTFGSWRETFTVPVTIVPPGAPLVEALNDDSLTPAMLNAIRLKEVSMSLSTPYPQSAMYLALFQLSSIPQNVAFQLVLRQTPATNKPSDAAASGSRDPAPAEELHLGEVVWTAGESGLKGLAFFAPNLNPNPGQSFDLILRPSVKAAEANDNLTKYWHGELAYPNINIINKDNPPAEAPNPTPAPQEQPVAPR